MKGYSREGTAKTPTIRFDIDTGNLEIMGRSIPEDPIEYYRGLIDSLTEYAVSLPIRFHASIQLEYFNTSSSRCLYTIFKKLENMKKAGTLVVINWSYEESDEEMLEVGEDFAAMLELPFNMVPVSR